MGCHTFLAHVDAVDRGRVDAAYGQAMSGGGDWREVEAVNRLAAIVESSRTRSSARTGPGS